MTYMAGVCVVGPLGGLLGHGVASMIGGDALVGLEAEVSKSHPASQEFHYPLDGDVQAIQESCHSLLFSLIHICTHHGHVHLLVIFLNGLVALLELSELVEEMMRTSL